MAARGRSSRAVTMLPTLYQTGSSRQAVLASVSPKGPAFTTSTKPLSNRWLHGAVSLVEWRK